MNDKSGGHRPRPAWLGLMGALFAIVGVVLLAACSSTNATASGTDQRYRRTRRHLRTRSASGRMARQLP